MGHGNHFCVSALGTMAPNALNKIPTFANNPRRDREPLSEATPMSVVEREQRPGHYRRYARPNSKQPPRYCLGDLLCRCRLDPQGREAAGYS